MPQLSEKQKYEIIVKHEIGMNDSNIARDMNIARTTVIRWIKRYNNSKNISRHTGSGRKKKLEGRITGK
jgi:transposase